MWQVVVSFIVKYVPVERIVAYVVNKLVEKYLSQQAVEALATVARINKTVEHLGEIAAVAANAVGSAVDGGVSAGQVEAVVDASRALLSVWANGLKASGELERAAGVDQGEAPGT